MTASKLVGALLSAGFGVGINTGHKVFLATLLIASTSAGPFVKRAEDVVQGNLGTDSYWNDYDG
jgi:hypothetical protein